MLRFGTSFEEACLVSHNPQPNGHGEKSTQKLAELSDPSKLQKRCPAQRPLRPELRVLHSHSAAKQGFRLEVSLHKGRNN